jgi:predicted ATPase/signal transduction histidine kinase/tRNA A-37 threonylcarbamoyl transferase component Bud32
MLNIPNYQIGTQIYESANSLVYRGVRFYDNQPVILKVLKEDYPTPEELTRYRQEYEITHDLDLTGVIKAYSIEKYQNTLAIILEDFGGESLRQLMVVRPFTLKEFLPLAIQIAEALGHIHLANIIHKDINPANIVWHQKTNQLKIIDFGIASRLPRENPVLKNPEQLEGTLAYLSPEQTGRMNRSLDYRTDLYSLGVTFYELLTGKQPFESDSAMELVHCHLAKTPKPVSEINPEVPLIISDIIMKLMAKNVEDRYQSAFGVKFDLEKVQENLTDEENLPGFKNLAGLNALDFELAQNDFSGKLQIPPKLYGRENEINTLLQAFERVCEGATEMMLVAGYSGVGKTALVHEVHKPMTEKHGYFAAGKFDQFQRNIPYSALTAAFNEFCHYLLTENSQILNQWREKILTAVGNNGQILIDVIPQLELVIGPQPAVAQMGPTEAQNRFHLVFQNFFRAICQKNHPLVLFIDDLQWADLASLNLLKTLMTDRDSRYFLIIGAYRDNDVDATHPLMMTVEELQEVEALVNTISLPNLSQNDVNTLMADALVCERTYVAPLTDLVYEKTQGNAFFTHEFFKSLYEKSLLVFEHKTQRWQWQLNQIIALDMTDNVISLMVNKIDQLQTDTIDVLKLASCIGNQFDLKTLSIISKHQPSETLVCMWPAVQEGLLLPLDENYKQLEFEKTNSYFKFQHDRVQQAAYSLIEETTQSTTHLTIGRLLLANTEAHSLTDKLFDIVNQFNEGFALITDKTEQLKVAELNLQAGIKAKASAAYKPAFDYLQTGIALLGSLAWQLDYDLNLTLHNEAAEAAYLNADFEASEMLIKVVLQSTTTVLDQVKVYETQMQSLVAQNQFLASIDIGMQLLEKLGISLSETPPTVSIEVLSQLPKMTAPDKLAAMRTLILLTASVYSAKPELFPSIIFTMIKLTIHHGTSPLAILSYAFYGFLLSSLLGNIEEGYQWGQFALQKTNQLETKEITIKVTHAVNYFIHCKKPARQALEPLRENIQISLEAGDYESAAYSAADYGINLFLIGESLQSVYQRLEANIRLMQKLNQDFHQLILEITGQIVLNLRDETDVLFNEVEQMPMLDNNLNAKFVAYLAKTILGYLFEEPKVVDDLKLAKNCQEASIGSFYLAQLPFYESLILLSLFPSDGRTHSLNEIEANQQQIKNWANHAPMNFQHKYDLVEAEKARVLGQDLAAMDLYETAIAGARENEYLHEEALAYELAAKFYLARGMERIAQTYLKEAHYRYQQWGANAKVKDLEERYWQWLTPESTKAIPTTFTRTSTATILASTRSRTHSSQWLDLESVMKAAQTLSGEIVLSRLLSKMMHIVIENAGAQRGFLILPKDDKWVIEAEGRLDKKEVTVLHSLPVSHHLPEAIISYVARTQENVVLADARQEGLYTENPYIKTHQTQSVLCFPIVYQQQLRAILYLENNLTTGAFTETRLNILKMLSSQIAISLENAQWVSTLDTKVKERTAQLNAKVEELTQTRQELVQSEKMASLGRLVAGFAHELNTPLGVALSSASLLQRKLTDMNQFMEQDEVDEDELVAVLDSIDKAATLNVSNLKRAANLVTSFKRTAIDQTSDKVRTFEVKQLLEDTINTLHSRFKKTEIEISMICSNDFKVKSLPGALEQILTNLMMNSLIHGFNEGQNAGAINIKAQLDGDNLHLEYSDNGKGIAQENLEKIFEPFFTTHRAHGGSGLGMYICYNLVTTQLQGTITCESQLGKGVVFKIDYPI